MDQPERNKYNISIALRLILNAKGISISELSRKTSIDKSSLRKYINERRSPSYTTIIKIADALNMDPDYFIKQSDKAYIREIGMNTYRNAIHRIQNNMDRIHSMPEGDVKDHLFMKYNTILNQAATQIENLVDDMQTDLNIKKEETSK